MEKTAPVRGVAEEASSEARFLKDQVSTLTSKTHLALERTEEIRRRLLGIETPPIDASAKDEMGNGLLRDLRTEVANISDELDHANEVQDEILNALAV